MDTLNFIKPDGIELSMEPIQRKKGGQQKYQMLYHEWFYRSTIKKLIKSKETVKDLSVEDLAVEDVIDRTVRLLNGQNRFGKEFSAKRHTCPDADRICLEIRRTGTREEIANSIVGEFLLSSSVFKVKVSDLQRRYAENQELLTIPLGLPETTPPQIVSVHEITLGDLLCGGPIVVCGNK